MFFLGHTVIITVYMFVFFNVLFWFQILLFLASFEEAKKTVNFRQWFFCFLFVFWGKYNVNMTFTIITISHLFKNRFAMWLDAFGA